MGCVRVCEVFQGSDMAASDPRWVESVASLNWVWLPTGTNDGHFATILYLHLSEKLLRSWICLFQQVLYCLSFDDGETCFFRKVGDALL